MPSRRARERGSAAVVHRIQSESDAFQLALSLRTNRRQRRRQGRFIVEGVRNIERAVEHGWAIESFWYIGGRRSRWAQSLIASGAAERLYELPPRLMAELSDKEQASELLALARLPPDDLSRISPSARSPLLVAFDRPVSPGNLGSVIRSADAFGADGLVITGHGADVYDPQTVRASMGSLFAVPVVHAPSTAALTGWIATLRERTPGLRVVGSSAVAARPLTDVNLGSPVLLALGNETRGLSQSWRDLCDELVVIPMRGSADSLNVAAAAAILLYEVDRRRRMGAA